MKSIKAELFPGVSDTVVYIILILAVAIIAGYIIMRLYPG